MSFFSPTPRVVLPVVGGLIALAVWVLVTGAPEAPARPSAGGPTSTSTSTPNTPQTENDGNPKRSPLAASSPEDEHSAAEDEHSAAEDEHSAAEAPLKHPEHSGKFRPHPDSPARTQLLRQRQLMEQAKNAARAADPATLRAALDEYARLPESDMFADWQEGYRLVLACLEEASAASKSAAQEFVDTARGSTVRRDVRKLCGL